MYIVLDVINYINCKDRVTLSLSGRKTHLDRYRYTRKEPLNLGMQKTILAMTRCKTGASRAVVDGSGGLK